VLPSFLNSAFETLLVALEAADLGQTRQRLIEKWDAFENDGGIGKTHFDRQYDYLESKPFDYVEKLVKNVRILASEGLDTRDSYELAMLESILRKTPVLLRKRQVEPENEQHIRQVMHDYLGAFFTQYKPEITITGVMKDFKPDGGVRNLTIRTRKSRGPWAASSRILAAIPAPSTGPGFTPSFTRRRLSSRRTASGPNWRGRER
jgi:hypothetical protein